MVYNFGGLKQFLSRIDFDCFNEWKGTQYYNLPCSFDIETTSFYDGENKRGVMYQWQFAINNDVIFGRDWQQFFFMLKKLEQFLNLCDKRRIIIFVHNLAFEFQFLNRWLEWSRIFATDVRKPIQAVSGGFEFRCSMRMSGYSLEVLAKNLTKHKIRKLKGDLNYNLMRNELTPLTRKEKLYCLYDVLIVNAYIDELKDCYGTIAAIPLTQTGFVREYVRRECFSCQDYKTSMKSLTLSPNEYKILERAYMGGFTHCNAYYANTVLDDVSSYDFTSSYPTVLLSEKYPMGKGRKFNAKTVADIERLSKHYCVLCRVHIETLRAKFKYENIISFSRCLKIKNQLVNNGRVVKGDCVELCLTEIDLFNILKFYDCGGVNVLDCYAYEKSYLPKPIVKSVLKFYNDKTKLKGVAGKEQEYLKSKEMLNSIYGMCVTSIVHNDIGIDGGQWFEKPNDLSDELTKYNFSKSRFLFYPWGVWVTAYARNNLFGAILECGRDYVYSDTDSVKIMNADNHKEYFGSYNKSIVDKLERCLLFHNLDLSLIRPKNIKGVEKVLGVWDYEGIYNQFKSLGAKRYLTLSGGKYSVTACGLSKKKGREVIEKSDNPFEFFSDNMTIDKEHSGRMTHTYGDYEVCGQLTDYLGNVSHYYEKSFVHLEKSEWRLSLASQYINYFMGLRYE